MQSADDGNVFELDCTRLRIPKCSIWEDFGTLLEQKTNPSEIECVRFWVLTSKVSMMPSSEEPVGEQQCLWGRVLTHRPSYSNEMRSRDRTCSVTTTAQHAEHVKCSIDTGHSSSISSIAMHS